MAGDLRGDKYIDSRDVIERMEELESELTDAHDTEFDEWVDSERVPDDDTDKVPSKFDDWLQWVNDTGPSHLYWSEVDEYLDLKALCEEASGASDWAYGETLIRDSEFVAYAKELAVDTGAIARDAEWPACHIDWDAAADALKIDYMEVEFSGRTYLVRA